MKTQNKSTTVKAEKLKCLGDCGKEKAPNNQNFYSHNNPFIKTERYPVCKECIQTFVGEAGSLGYLDRVKLTLANLNRPFIISQWASRDEDWSKYIVPVSSLPPFSSMSYKDSVFSDGVSENNLQGSEGDHQDEHKYYSSKWMGEYTKTDIDYLEEYYIGLDRDFKIVTTNHKDYARKICKASLHMDKCFQDVLSGVAGADKKYKDAKEVFDTLSKSAQFSESQRGQNDVGLGCFGVTFDQVEQNKWIPKHIPMDEDAIDKMINQFATIKESV